MGFILDAVHFRGISAPMNEALLAQWTPEPNGSRGNKRPGTGLNDRADAEVGAEAARLPSSDQERLFAPMRSRNIVWIRPDPRSSNEAKRSPRSPPEP